jgi:CHAD domain-containing protein
MKAATRVTLALGDGTPVNPAYRVLQHAISEALEGISASPPITDEAIHDARKALKKARAALRLLRDGMSKTVYRRQNAGLRDAGRFLSPFRDARSLIDAFDALHERYADPLQGFDLAPLQKLLHANLVKARRHFSHTPAEQENCIRLLRECIALLKEKDVASIDFDAIDTGLRHIYRKGCKARAEARATQTPETLHEWRKQVKYLLNAVEGLHPLAKGATAKTLKWADHLADSLGDDHDLAMLSRETARGVYAPVEADLVKALDALIDRRRATLQKRAFGLGKKLYGKKPRQFSKSIPPYLAPSVDP